MSHARLIFVCLLCWAIVAACQRPAAGDPGSPDPSGSASAAATPDSAEPASAVPADETSMKLVRLAREDLAERLDVTPPQIELDRVAPVHWRDGSLGCPRPGVDYLQVEVPGYTIWLRAAGQVYEYHTDESNRVVLCDEP
jgi:hypothetical protein